MTSEVALDREVRFGSKILPDGKVNDKFDFTFPATKTSLTKKEMTFRFLTDLLSLFCCARRRGFGCVGQMVFVAMSSYAFAPFAVVKTKGRGCDFCKLLRLVCTCFALPAYI